MPTSTGWPFAELLNFIRSGKVFFFFRAVNNVGIFRPQQLLVGRNNDDFQLVDLVELRRFRLCRSGHARQLLEHAEIILEGDRRERLILALDLDALLGFNRLMQTVRPAPPRHHAPGEFIDDDDFAVFNHIFHILAIERMRLDRRFDVMLQRPVFRIGDVADAEQFFDFLPAFVGDGDVAVLLVDRKVAGQLRRLAGGDIKFFALFKLGNDAVDLDNTCRSIPRSLRK